LKTESPIDDLPQDLREEVSRSPLGKEGGAQGDLSKLVACSEPDSIEAEHFRTLRAQILFPKNGKGERVIMVTSVFPGEGKTFVAANLGASLAQGINEHVLLVDCDLRHPELHEMLGCPNNEGLQEYLTGKKGLPDVIIRTRIDKLSLLPAGRPSQNPSELLSSAKMRALLGEVKARYHDRFIIVDAAPTHVASESSVLSNYVDGILFVVMAERTPRKAVKRSIEYLGREKILGIVFNGYDGSKKMYGKYYREYYSNRPSENMRQQGM